MNWSIRIGGFAGVPFRAHVSLVAALVAAAAYAAADGSLIGGTLAGALVAALVLASVFLHEIGHVLVARAFGVRMRDVTLLPIGGMSTPLDEEPERPLYAFLTGLAGPVSSLLVALGCWALASVTAASNLFALLVDFNVLIGLLNLVPAWPLDGGRIVRGGLTGWMGKVRATRMAAKIARFIAVASIVLGIYYGEWLFVALGVFVFIAASIEERAVIIRDAIGNRVASDVMTPVRRMFGVSASLEEVGREADLDSVARAWPVTFGEKVLGVLYREPVLEALDLGEKAPRLQDLLDRNVLVATPEQPLKELLAAMGTKRSRTALVLDKGGDLRGLVLLDHVVEEINRGGEREF